VHGKKNIAAYKKTDSDIAPAFSRGCEGTAPLCALWIEGDTDFLFRNSLTGRSFPTAASDGQENNHADEPVALQDLLLIISFSGVNLLALPVKISRFGFSPN